MGILSRACDGFLTVYAPKCLIIENKRLGVLFRCLQLMMIGWLGIDGLFEKPWNKKYVPRDFGSYAWVEAGAPSLVNDLSSRHCADPSSYRYKWSENSYFHPTSCRSLPVMEQNTKRGSTDFSTLTYVEDRSYLRTTGSKESCDVVAGKTCAGFANASYSEADGSCTCDNVDQYFIRNPEQQVVHFFHGFEVKFGVDSMMSDRTSQRTGRIRTMVQTKDGQPCFIGGINGAAPKAEWAPEESRSGIRGTVQELLQCAGLDLDSKYDTGSSILEENTDPHARVTGIQAKLQLSYYEGTNDEVICYAKLIATPMWTGQRSSTILPSSSADSEAWRERTAFGIDFQLETLGAFYKMNLHNTIAFIVTVIVLMSFPAEIVYWFSLFSLGLLSKIYYKAANDRFDVHKRVPGLAARMMGSSSVFRTMQNASAMEDPPSMKHRDILFRLNDCFSNQMEGILDDREVTCLANFVIARLDANDEGGVNMTEYVEACTENEAVDLRDLANLFDADRPVSFLEQLFTPDHVSVTPAISADIIPPRHSQSDLESIERSDDAGDGKINAADSVPTLRFQSSDVSLGRSGSRNIAGMEIDMQLTIAKKAKEAVLEVCAAKFDEVERRFATMESILEKEIQEFHGGSQPGGGLPLTRVGRRMQLLSHSQDLANTGQISVSAASTPRSATGSEALGVPRALKWQLKTLEDAVLIAERRSKEVSEALTAHEEFTKKQLMEFKFFLDHHKNLERFTAAKREQRLVNELRQRDAGLMEKASNGLEYSSSASALESPRRALSHLTSRDNSREDASGAGGEAPRPGWTKNLQKSSSDVSGSSASGPVHLSSQFSMMPMQISSNGSALAADVVVPMSSPRFNEGRSRNLYATAYTADRSGGAVSSAAGVGAAASTAGRAGGTVSSFDIGTGAAASTAGRAGGAVSSFDTGTGAAASTAGRAGGAVSSLNAGTGAAASATGGAGGAVSGGLAGAGAGAAASGSAFTGAAASNTGGVFAEGARSAALQTGTALPKLTLGSELLEAAAHRPFAASSAAAPPPATRNVAPSAGAGEPLAPGAANAAPGAAAGDGERMVSSVSSARSASKMAAL